MGVVTTDEAIVEVLRAQVRARAEMWRGAQIMGSLLGWRSDGAPPSATDRRTGAPASGELLALEAIGREAGQQASARRASLAERDRWCSEVTEAVMAFRRALRTSAGVGVLLTSLLLP